MSLEVGLARVEEGIKQITQSLTVADESRKELRGMVYEQGTSIALINQRIEVIENKLSKTAPTLEEFLTLKKQAQGAGMLGKALWSIGGVIIAVAAALYSFATWLFTHGTLTK